MSEIFVSVPGRMVLAAKNNGPKGLLLQLPGTSIGGVVTRLAVSGRVAAQMAPSLDQTFYIVPFGDQPGSLQVGVMLNTTCDGTNGIDHFIRYYRDQRLSPSNAQPATMAIGASAFFGYVTDFAINAESSHGHVIQGTLSFVAWMAL